MPESRRWVGTQRGELIRGASSCKMLYRKKPFPRKNNGSRISRPQGWPINLWSGFSILVSAFSCFSLIPDTRNLNQQSWITAKWMGQLVLFVWGLYGILFLSGKDRYQAIQDGWIYRMNAFLTTKYGFKTIFGFSGVSIFNVHTGCHYKNLLLFQIVN